MAPLVSTKFVLGLVACQVSCRVGPSSDLDTGSCTRAREVMIFCTIKSKPLALPWGRTPRLDSGVRVDPQTDRLRVDPRTDCLIGGSADGSSTSGSADGSLSSGPKPMRDWALPWPVIDRFSQEAQMIMWPKPRGLVYPLYVIKSPQSSMILPVGYFLRAVINARLLLLFPPCVLFLCCTSSELVTLQLRGALLSFYLLACGSFSPVSMRFSIVD
ncbi:hypothetical protein Tco_0265064 [Tanacetum coccineum]